MFGLFKKKANVAKESLKRLENKDLMEAMVGGCLLIAFADGDCEEAELLKMDEVLRTSKALEGGHASKYNPGAFRQVPHQAAAEAHRQGSSLLRAASAVL